MPELRIPLLARRAQPSEGDQRGRTVETRAIPGETTDEPQRSFGRASGTIVPLLAARSTPVAGTVQGRTYITKAGGETTDDEGPSPVRWADSSP